MTVQEYYDQVPAAAKKQLQNLRALIIKRLGQPDEIISYQIPHFVSNGKRALAIAAWKQHVSLYPLSSGVLKKFSKELAVYKTGPGTIQFSLDQKLPEQLINSVVKARLLELKES